MNFTFGIITNGQNDSNINLIIDSIEQEKIPNYEVIIVGKTNVIRDKTITINFDESIRTGWITKKKNDISKLAKYDNIVFLHDYIVLNNGWYDGQLMSGNDFNVRMDKIINYDGTRFRDWCIWPHNGNFMDALIGRNCLLPYDITNLTKYQYISGSYWIAKKQFMLTYPLNENLSWGQGEDVEWSKIIRNVVDFNMNINSSVRIIKPNKDRAFDETTADQIEILKTL